MKKVLLAAVLAAFVAMPAYASVQNVKVSGDIESTYVVRNQFDLGSQVGTEKYRQNFLLTQTRLRVDADLTDNVQTTVRLINERVWGVDNVATNDVDLNLAYVTLKEMLYSPLTVIIGRQEFAFGNSFVIDTNGTNNSAATGGIASAAGDLTKRTAQDAVRAILDYNPLTINVIASKISSGNFAGTGALKDDINLLGTNAAYQLGDKWQTMVEAYYWAKLDQSNLNASGAGAKTDTVYMPGVHASTNPIKGLNLSAELALQRGNKATSGTAINIKREATAAQLIANYALPIAKIEKYSPTVMGAYTYVSGERHSWEAGNSPTGDDTRYTGWDPMFENQAGGTIYNTLFNLTNAHIVTLKASAKPIEDVTASIQMDNLWLDKNVEGGTIQVIGPDNSTTNLASTNNAFLGSELGLGLAYAYTDDVTLGAKLNWFTPGDAFSSNNQNVASQILVNANVNF